MTGSLENFAATLQERFSESITEQDKTDQYYKKVTRHNAELI